MDFKTAFPLLTIGWYSVHHHSFQILLLAENNAAIAQRSCRLGSFGVLALLSGRSEPLEELLVAELSFCTGQVREGPHSRWEASVAPDEVLSSP